LGLVWGGSPVAEGPHRFEVLRQRGESASQPSVL